MDNDVFIKFSVGAFCGKSNIVVSEFNYLYVEVWV